MSQLEEIKARAEKVSGFCVDYMRAGIRHLQRNCDVECPVHDQENSWVACKEPDRYDGDTIAQVLNDAPKLVSALEAVEVFTAKRAIDLRNHADALNSGSPAEERFTAYADEASATAATVFDLIREALA